jgi:hypothetical protein
MKTSALWGLVLVAGGSATAAREDKGVPPASPELKVLGRFAGTWDTVATFRASGEKARDETFKGTTTVGWSLGGRFLQWRGRHPGRLEDFQLMTYDPERKEYRQWYFSSEGTADESAGRWDEKKLTMTWSGGLSGGRTMANEVRFPDKDTQEWKLVVKDRAGKVVVDAHGKLTRRK